MGRVSLWRHNQILLFMTWALGAGLDPALDELRHLVIILLIQNSVLYFFSWLQALVLCFPQIQFWRKNWSTAWWESMTNLVYNNIQIVTWILRLEGEKIQTKSKWTIKNNLANGKTLISSCLYFVYPSPRLVDDLTLASSSSSHLRASDSALW